MKVCSRCKKELSFNKFHRHRNSKDGYQARCKICNIESVREKYKTESDYKQAIKERANINQKKFYDYVDEIKSRSGCILCFENDAILLDFHHLVPSEKEHCISHIIRKKNKKKLDQEIAKCIIICAHCHRRYHAGRFSLLTDKPGGSIKHG